MKFGKHTAPEPEPLVLAPLIDIVFLTLVFFMVTSAFGSLETEVDITLPTADTGRTSERMQGEIFVNLLADGTIVVNERPMDLPELQQVLDRIAEYFPGGSVIIRGDHEAHLGRVVAVLDACRRADIQHVAFAAMPTDTDAGSAEQTP